MNGYDYWRKFFLRYRYAVIIIYARLITVMNAHRLAHTLAQIRAIPTAYRVWLTGRSVYDVDNARDIDIRLTGELCVDTLSPILEQLSQIHLVDAAWVSDLVTADRSGHLSVDCVLWYPGLVPPLYTRLGSSLIQGNYKQLNLPMKSHQRRCLSQNNCFPCVDISLC